MVDEISAEKPAAPDLFTPEERAYFEQRAPETPPEAEPSSPTEATQAAAKPAPTPSPPPASPPKQETVPQAALHEERKRRQEAEERARQTELVNARMEERFRMWQQAAGPPPEPPNPDTDIFGTVKFQGQELARQRQEIEGYKQQVAARQQMEALHNWCKAHENAYRQRVPDYDKALHFLKRARANELKATTPWNDTQILQQVANEERQLIAQAAQWQRNPADMAYRNAQARGYRANAAPAAPPPNPAQRLNVIEAGQQAARSLTGVGGRAAVNPEMTIENLTKMSDREFDAWKTKNPAKYRKLKGG
jgi:hypothetical protein